MRKTFFSGGMILLVGLVQAQTSQNIRTLYILLGDWEVNTYEIGATGRWEAGTPSTSRITSVLGGQFIEEQSIFRGKSATQTIKRTFAYDTRHRKFKVTTLDQESGIMNTAIGEMEGGVLIADNLNDAGVKNVEGIPQHYQYTMDVKNQDEIRLNVNMTLDGGATWKGVNMMIYRRIR